MCKFCKLREEVCSLREWIRIRQNEIDKDEIREDPILEQFRGRLRQINNELCNMLARRISCTC